MGGGRHPRDAAVLRRGALQDQRAGGGAATGSFTRRTFRFVFCIFGFWGVSEFPANLRKSPQNLRIDFASGTALHPKGRPTVLSKFRLRKTYVLIS